MVSKDNANIQEAIKMGTYLNPGKASYIMVEKSEIFIDKTKMI
jgi:hypothetical protein